MFKLMTLMQLYGIIYTLIPLKSERSRKKEKGKERERNEK
jgi:hypothetical protein